MSISIRYVQSTDCTSWKHICFHTAKILPLNYLSKFVFSVCAFNMQQQQQHHIRAKAAATAAAEEGKVV